jgi:hypothetical protein
MDDPGRQAEIAAMKLRLAELEGVSAKDAPKSQESNSPTRRVGLLLFVGILLFPYVFAWFLLGKGYSQTSRIIGFGWLALLLVVIAASDNRVGSGNAGASSSAGMPPVDPNRQIKDEAVAVAKIFVPKAMKDPASAQFGDVWGMGKDMACGVVNGKNSFGAMAGQQRFIFASGSVEFDDNSRRFGRHWNTLCVDKALSKAPVGVGQRRWGSSPSPDLKRFMPTTSDKLDLYVPKGTISPFYGIPVREEDFRYDHRRLYAVDMFIDGEQEIQLIRDALVSAYGIPTSYDESAHSYKWTWPNSHVTMTMDYQDSSKRTTVTVAHGSY